tara:strand:+ start:191 stop:346 length:156 start_codon:yes stop_codon:yes gene_type:complete
MCELCDEDVTAIRRDDNIYVCDKCDKKYPINTLMRICLNWEEKKNDKETDK